MATCLLAVANAGCGKPEVLRSSPELTPVWSAQLGGEGLQEPLGLAAAGDVVVLSGLYDAELTVADRSVAGTGGLEGIVIAFDGAGHLRFMHELTGARQNEAIYAVAAAPSGDVFVSGRVGDGATFGGHTFTTDASVAAMLAKLSPDGEVAWTVTGRGGGNQAARSLAVAPDGAVYLAGSFTTDLDLGQGLLASGQDGDAFLARFTPDGVLEWARSLTGADLQHIVALAIGPRGEVNLIGWYVQELVLESETFAKNGLSGTTPFAAQFTADGSLAWLQTAVVPPELDYVGREHVHTGHAPVTFQDTALAVAPSGAITTAITYGSTFGTGDEHAVPAVNHLIATVMDSAGAVVSQSTLAAPDAQLFFCKAISHDDATEVIVAWSGQMPDLGAGAVAGSDGLRGLAVLDLRSDGGFVRKGTFFIPEVSLTSQDAVRTHDGSLLTAFSWYDMTTAERDIFFARFR